MNSKELREKSLHIAHEARSLLNTIAADGSNKAEIESQFDKMMDDADGYEARAVRIEEHEERERSFAAADSRTPAETTVAKSGDEASEARAKAFEGYLRGTVSEQELRTAQAVGTSNLGGYLVPTTLSSNLIEAMKAFGPMNEGGPATYYNTESGNPINFAKLDDTANIGAQIAENTAASAANVQFGQVSLGAWKYTTGIVLVSNELLQDSALDVQQIVASAMAKRMGRVKNRDLTVGAGATLPLGIVAGSSLGATAASATAIAADDIMELVHSVDPAYRGGASFQLNDSTLKAIRKLKDGQGRYIWEQSYQVGVPSTILGYRYDINQDMASIATGNKIMIFGDMSKYTVRNVRGFALKRLDEAYAVSDQVAFVGFSRFDGNLLDTAAVKYLKNA